MTPFALFGLAFLLSVGVGLVFARYAASWRIIDQPGVRKVHEKATPRTGGLAMVAAGALACGFGLVSGRFPLPSLPWQTWVAGLGFVLVGALDDRFSYQPRQKFLVLLFFSGVAAWPWALKVLAPGFGGIQLGPLLVRPNVLVAGTGLTFWFMALTNAINIEDAINGYIGGISMIILAALAFRNLPTWLPLGLLAGFVALNWPKAIHFMGDSGSLGLGFLLGECLLRGGGFHSPVLALILTAPISMDVAMGIVRRRRLKKSLFDADDCTLPHHVLRLFGGSALFASGLLWGNALVFVALASHPLYAAGYALVFTGALVLFNRSYLFPRRRSPAAEGRPDGLRILVVSQYFWPEHFRINDLAAGLVEAGHEVDVLTGCPNYPSGRIFEGYGLLNGRETYQGVRIHRVPLIPRGSGSGLRLGLNYLSYMISASILGPLLCSEKYDVIFVCQLSPVTVGIPALVLKALKRTPVAFWVLDLWPESLALAGGSENGFAIRAVDRLVKFIYRRCDRILYASKGFAQSILDRGAAPDDLVYFPNWVEPVKDSGILCPVFLPKGFRILFAGNVGEAQDFGTILDAADRLRANPSIQWIILGQGRNWNWVKAQVEARGLGGCVHLLGHFQPETMPAFFRQADALLVTLRNDPAFALTVPGKVTHYMSCGRPILGALDGEGASLIKKAGAGFCVPAGDGEGLARIALSLSQMPEQVRREIGRRAKAHCDEHFDRAKLFRSLEATLQQLVPGDVGAPRTPVASEPLATGL